MQPRLEPPELAAPSSRPVVTIAPAFTIGLNGRLDASSTMIELNGFPDGSTPTLASSGLGPGPRAPCPNTNGFEIDWIVNARRRVTDLEDLTVGGDDADAEPVGIGLAELGDIVATSPSSRCRYSSSSVA